MTDTCNNGEQARRQEPNVDDREAFDEAWTERRQRFDALDEEPSERGDGRIAPGEVRNPWGRAGKPENRARLEAEKRLDFGSMMERALRKPVTVTENGRQIVIATAEFLTRKAITDIATAPPKQRLELLLGRRSVFREYMERAMEPEPEQGAWTEELDARFADLIGSAELAQLDEDRREQERLYEAYQRWYREQQSARRDEPDGLTQSQRFTRFLDEVDKERRRREIAEQEERPSHDRRDDDRDLRHDMIGGL